MVAKRDVRRPGINRLGWLPDLPDMRDHLYAAPPATMAKLPAKMDLRPRCPPVYDQGDLGSCTGNAIAAALQFNRRKQKLKPDFVPSRLFIYYGERVIEGTVGADAGAQLRDGIKVVAKQGAPPEADWPYDIAKFTQKPSTKAFQQAMKYQAVSYSRVSQTLSQLKGCLASGFPFVFGFSIYDSFQSDDVTRTGVVPMPSTKEHMLGGHAVMAVGYDDKDQRFIVRNSWGKTWGMQGYFTLPYPYLTERGLSHDFWTIRLVEA
ncbi:MAG: C1 family peptidase [Acetobacteraceae bacterium]